MKEKPAPKIIETHPVIKEAMMTFDSDIKVENLIENSFHAARRAVYDLFPNKLQGNTIKSPVDKIQQIKSVYKLRENYETNPKFNIQEILPNSTPT